MHMAHGLLCHSSPNSHQLRQSFVFRSSAWTVEALHFAMHNPCRLWPKHTPRALGGARQVRTLVMGRACAGPSLSHIMSRAARAKDADQRMQAWHDMLRAFAQHAMVNEAMAVLDDVRACGQSVSVGMIDMVLEAAVKANHTPLILRILALYEFAPAGTNKVSPILPARRIAHWTQRTYTLLLEHCARTGNLEYMLALLNAAELHSVALDEQALAHVLTCTQNAREPRLALEIVEKAERAHGVSALTWMRTLRVCATHAYAPGLDVAWAKSRPLEPDAGLLDAVLMTASRANMSWLAMQVLACMPSVDDTQLMPAFTAFCRAQRFDDALHILTQMRARGVDVSPIEMLPLTKAAAKPNALDAAVDALFRAPNPPTAVWNAVLFAAADVPHPVLARKLAEAMPEPNTDTIHAWMQCCIAAKHLDDARVAWSFMHQHRIAPSPTCYERMARIHLMHPHYEDAFALLEEAKRRGLLPTRRMYAAMIWTCAKHKDERMHDLLHEMQEANYEPGERLRALADVPD